MLEAAEWNIIGDAKRRVFTLCEINATERVEIKEKSAEPGLAEASRKIDTSGGGTITRVTQAVSGGRHDGFKYFRPEARAPACLELSELLSTRGDRARCRCRRTTRLVSRKN